ncbi:MAG: non-canonical purine NTP diphosphatase [Bacteroidales bacterium]|jgi:XTP/dITP diphosphohydrolase|nr:non-canonical purine NTP diphosphatase [Bacteroidales bacterium]
MKQYVIATNNAHKIEEIRQILNKGIEILSLKDLNIREDIPETSKTIEGNSEQKARYIYEKYNKNCFADDTGLFVEALNGEPGVYSARYAGENCSFEDNIDKLLMKMEGKTMRKAYFRTVICLIEEGKEHFFEGKIEGTIATERYGKGGFGYDPIFFPKNSPLSFAELPLEEKNKLSHRGIATRKLAQYLMGK